MELNNPYGLGTQSLVDVWRDEAGKGRGAMDRARDNPAPTPFYRGAMPTQPNPTQDWPRGFAEGFTSSFAEGYSASKKETEPFFAPQVAAGGWMNGMPVRTDFEQSRQVPSTMFNNAAPAPVTVGRGLGLGFTSDGTGGFHQFDARDYAQDRNVDELRALSNPRTSGLAGRVLQGKSTVESRGLAGTTVKNRTEKTAETGEKYFLTTAAGNLKQSAVPMTVDRCTGRECGSDTGGQAGPAGRASAHAVPGEAAPVLRNQLEGYADRGQANGRGATTAGAHDDFGRTAVLVYENGRDTTTCQTRVANLQSVVKAATAPLADALKLTRKLFTLESSRTFGNLQSTMPAKMTVYDPNATAKTTIKETTIHDVMMGNLRGPQRVVTYDPDAPAARTTIRETLEAINPNRNMRGATLKLTVIDPDERARTTVKETTLQGYRPGGPRRDEGKGFLAAEWDAKMTQRAVFEDDTEYAGNPRHEAGNAYASIDVDAKLTQRAVHTADPEYGGGARASTLGQTDDAAERCAYVNTTRDGILAQREPTQTSVKSAAGKDFVVTQAPTKRQPCAERETLDPRFPAAGPFKPCDGASTRDKTQIVADDRLDPSLLDAYRKNPYTQSLNSAA